MRRGYAEQGCFGFCFVLFDLLVCSLVVFFFLLFLFARLGFCSSFRRRPESSSFFCVWEPELPLSFGQRVTLFFTRVKKRVTRKESTWSAPQGFTFCKTGNSRSAPDQ